MKKIYFLFISTAQAWLSRIRVLDFPCADERSSSDFSALNPLYCLWISKCLALHEKAIGKSEHEYLKKFLSAKQSTSYSNFVRNPRVFAMHFSDKIIQTVMFWLHRISQFYAPCPTTKYNQMMLNCNIHFGHFLSRTGIKLNLKPVRCCKTVRYIPQIQ